MPTMSHQTVRIGKGRHESPDGGEVCVMELASMLAGEPFSDRPTTVSPVLAAFLRGYNDALDDDRRQLLLPWAAACVGTGPASVEDEKERRRLIAAAAGGPVDRLVASFWVRDGATIRETGCEHVGRRVGFRVAQWRSERRHEQVRALVDRLIAVGPRTVSPAFHGDLETTRDGTHGHPARRERV